MKIINTLLLCSRDGQTLVREPRAVPLKPFDFTLEKKKIEFANLQHLSKTEFFYFLTYLMPVRFDRKFLEVWIMF